MNPIFRCDFGRCDFGRCDFGRCDFGRCDFGSRTVAFGRLPDV
ncbi:MAG: pentapeptide repeat-containing protein [Dehalococcoidia bacterium]|nr:pentapeptide repeat-containing protein [Dehalococcoidia bacterium]